MDRASERDARPSRAGPVHRLEWDLDYPPGLVAGYLIDGPEPVLIDAGVPGDRGQEQLVEELAAHGYAPADVDHLVVTHPHEDHTGQASTLVDAGATVYVAAMARDDLQRDPSTLETDIRETAVTVGVPEKVIPSYVDGAVAILERERRLMPPDEIDVAFGVDEPFTVGDHRFTPIHTPGHQRAQTCFAVSIGDREVLFSGDGLIEPFRPAAVQAWLEPEVYDAIGSFYDGLDRLADRRFDRVYPGHGPTFEDASATVDATVDRLDSMVAEVAEALATVEPATPNEVTIERAGIPEQPAPLLDTIGALGYLDAEDRATFDVGADGARRYRTVA